MTTAAADLLSPATLARIDNYPLLARVAVEGYLAGVHRSLSHGTGGEFLQYRNYTAGDDLKYIDWKVFSRSNRFHTKVFREETNMQCTLVLDASASLDYRGTRASCSKWRYASMLAACFAYLASRQGDQVGLYLYSDRMERAIRPSHAQGQLQRLLGNLAGHRPAGKADHPRTWNYLTSHLRSRGLVVFLSDFLESEDVLPPLLKRLRFAHHDCIAIQLLDPDEIELPFDRSIEFIDGEGGGRILTYPGTIRSEYRRRMNDFLEGLSEKMTRSHVDFQRLVTTDSIGHALATYLHKRDSLR